MQSDSPSTNEAPAKGGAELPAHEEGRWGQLFSGRNGIYSAALAGGVVLHACNMYVATTVMPSVVADIGGLDFYAWATTLFVVTSILAATLTAKLLKALGPRGAYCVALLIFAAGTIVAALASDMGMMLLGRSIQGFGGGFLYALAYAVTRLVFPAALWGRAVGLIGAMFGIATLIGPAIGGIFAELGDWRAAFWSLLPVIAIFAVVAFVSLPRTSPGKEERAPIAYAQILLLTAAVLIVSAGSLSPVLLWNLAGLGAAVVLIALIVVIERSGGARLLPRGSFSRGAPLGLVYLMIALLMTGVQPEIFVPYLVQTLHGQSPLWAGYLAALVAVGWSTASLLSPRFRGRGGDRLLIIGPPILLAGLVLLAIVMPVPGGGAWQWLAPICLGLILVGFGIGLTWPGLVTMVYRHAPTDEQDLASGGMTTVQLFAAALGAALAGMIANVAGVADPGGVAGASKAAFWIFALFALAPLASIVLARPLLRLAGARS